MIESKSEVVRRTAFIVRQSPSIVRRRGVGLAWLLPALCVASACGPADDGGDEVLSQALTAFTPPVLPTVVKNVASGLYLDVSGASTASGAQVVTWTFNGNANQDWQMTPMGNGWYEIVSRSSGKCLDVPNNSTSNGQTLQQWDCSGRGNQLFSLQTLNGNVQIVGQASGKCVQASSQGAGAVIWDCGTATSQQWSVTVAPSNVSLPSLATIQNASNSRYLDVSGVSKTAGAQVWVWSYTGGANQIWSFQSMGDGSYELISQNSGQCLDVPNNSTTSGQTLEQWTCWGGANQRYYLYALGNKVQIAEQGASKCLSSSGQTDGAAVTIQPCSATDTAQQWSVAATGGSSGGTCGGGTAQASDLRIDVASLQQKISGFGVSTAWGGDFVDPTHDPDMLWSTTTGAGLTLHRIRIGGGTTSETKIAQKAVTYGVKVWATPWEVKRSDISRDNCPNNSSCTPPPKLTNPQDWANTLATFVQNMKSQGVPIYAVSAENEPDSGGMNGTTSFTETEMATWVGSYLGPALAGTGAKVMAPETMNWWSFPSYFNALKANSAAYGSVSIFASHQYGRGPDDSGSDVVAVNQAIAADGSKEYWETEVDTGSTSDDPTADNMPSALHLAQTIHNDLTRASINAFHYWWLYAGGSSGLFDTNTKVWTKRFWIMGNFSRFARPGYRRVSTSGSVPSGVAVSAYTNPSDHTLAIVAINNNSAATSVPLYISSNVPCSLTPYETSGSKSLGQGSSLTVSGSRVTVTLAAKSVTTFVGKP